MSYSWRAGAESGAGRGCRGQGEAGQQAGVDPGDLGDVGEVDPLDHVAERHAVADLDLLMLAVEVLVGLGQADGGEPSLVERDVVAALGRSGRGGRRG